MEKTSQKLKHAANIPGSEGTTWKINGGRVLPLVSSFSCHGHQGDDTRTFKIYNLYNDLSIQIVKAALCRGEAPQAKLIEIPSTPDLSLLTGTRIFRG